MEPQQEVGSENVVSPLHKVTPLSKYSAMVLFVLLPFIGGWIGYTFAPEKIVEIEKIVVKEVPVVAKSNTSENSVKNESAESNSTEADDGWISPNVPPNDMPFGSVESAKQYLLAESDGYFDLDTEQYPRDMLIDNVGPTLPGSRFAIAEVELHNSQNDCWIVKDNRVYDVTKFISMKQLLPSLAMIEERCGKDLTLLFESQPVEKGSLNNARFYYALAEFFIGAIESL